VKHLRKRFNGAGFSGAGGTEKEKNAGWPTLRRKSGAKHLDIRNNCGDSGRLAYEAFGKLGL
jgi:hypothetical protein